MANYDDQYDDHGVHVLTKESSKDQYLCCNENGHGPAVVIIRAVGPVGQLHPRCELCLGRPGELVVFRLNPTPAGLSISEIIFGADDALSRD